MSIKTVGMTQPEGSLRSTDCHPDHPDCIIRQAAASPLPPRVGFASHKKQVLPDLIMEIKRSSSFLGLDIEASIASLEGAKPEMHPSACEDTDTIDGDETGENEAEATDKTASILKDENDAVKKVRILLLVVLCMSTIGIALALIFFSRSIEYSQFEGEFQSDTKRIAQEAGNKLSNILGAMESFLASTATLASVTNMTWPFVTTTDFAERTSGILRQTITLSLSQFHSVNNEQRQDWERYSTEHDIWVEQGIDFLKADSSFQGSIIEEYDTSSFIFDDEGSRAAESDLYLPKWQHAPVVPIEPPYNLDGKSSLALRTSLPLVQDGHAIISRVLNMADPSDPATAETLEHTLEWIRAIVGDQRPVDDPLSELYYPIFVEPGNNASTPAGVLSVAFFWADLLSNVFTSEEKELVAVFRNGCNDVFSMQIVGGTTKFLGEGDKHDPRYSYLEETFNIEDLSDYAVQGLVGFPLGGGSCPCIISLYPQSSYEKSFYSSSAVVFSIAAVCILAFSVFTFLLYDSMVEFRQGALMAKAVRADAIVSSLFPEKVRNRVHEADPDAAIYEPPKTRLKSFLQNSTKSLFDPDETNERDETRQIADLFPETTVLFADIAGFTAWSSVREPSHVFTLLEALYGAFDAIAAKRGVFKVETIGDCYVAVTGLPEPREDHAVVMVKFARDCRSKVVDITRELEVSLGPGTGDLRYRFGLHSGPVTAGVLRGKKSRFQLFGDTVNTAASMENTGEPHRIQISDTTAALIEKAGKSSWIRKRKEKVQAKGKGLIQTYWVDLGDGRGKSNDGLAEDASMTFSYAGFDCTVEFEDKIVRLINWNTDILGRLICKILERREVASIPGLERSSSFIQREGAIAIDEVKEIIQLPDFDAEAYKRQEGQQPVRSLPPHIMAQLKECVAMIAAGYEDNPFHNFEHASHVAMSAAKLLSRIVAPDKVYVDGVAFDKGTYAWSMHDHTFGIASDPLTQFACVFAAMIHDVGHPGVPNPQLIKEDEDLAAKYRNKSVAEQHSVDMAWSVFMDDRFKELRKTICHSGEDLVHFRELVVNSVIATDIFDPDLKQLRQNRWEKAFYADKQIEEPVRDRVNRKATIVIEHLIQASDVAHTMQHWHVYRKWNEYLFEEMYYAYICGRAEKDPSKFWYEGEMKFFDFYVIPLAKKLSDCGVFGVSSDEYLTYAIKNREEWERRGKEVVSSVLARLKRVTGRGGDDENDTIPSDEENHLPPMSTISLTLDSLK